MRRLAVLLARVLGALVLVGLVLAVAAWFTLRSEWFHRKVRERIIAEVEKASGGRAEIGSFSFDWRLMRAEVKGFVLHGREGAGEPPLFKAKTITVGLKVVSFFQRKVNIAMLDLEEPDFSLRSDPSGGTNLPQPAAARAPGKSPVERVIDLAVNEYRVRQGQFRYNADPAPLEIEGRSLEVRLDFKRAGPGGENAYEGTVQSKALRVTRPFASPIDFDTEAEIRIEKNKLSVLRSTVVSGRTRAEFSGALEPVPNLRLRGTAKGVADLSRMVPVLRLPLDPVGTADVWVGVDFRSRQDWRAGGTFKARDVSYQTRGIQVQPVRAQGRWSAGPQGLVVRSLKATAWDAEFLGDVRLDRWNRFVVKGAVNGLAVSRATDIAGRVSAQAAALNRPRWSGTIDGPVELESGLTGADLRVRAEANLTPAPGGIPIKGRIPIAYDAARGDVDLSDAHIELPASRLSFRGSSSGRVDVGLFTRDLNDLAPLLALLDDGKGAAKPLLESCPSAEKCSLPVALRQGTLNIAGQVSGGTREPRFEGTVNAGPLEWDRYRADKAAARIEIGADGARLTGVTITDGSISLSGDARVALADWRPQDSSAISGTFQLDRLPIERAVAELGGSIAASGVASVKASVEGTYRAPRLQGSFHLAPFQSGEESLDSVDGEFRYNQNRVEFFDGKGRKGASVLDFSGAVAISPARKRVESLDARLEIKSFPASQSATLRKQLPSLDGIVSGSLRLRGAGGASAMPIQAVEGKLELAQLTVLGRPAGEVSMVARTANRETEVDVRAVLRGGSRVDGKAFWTIGSNSPARVEMRALGMSFASLRDLGLLGDPSRALPFGGLMDAELRLSGPVDKFSEWAGEITVPNVELAPTPRTAARAPSRFAVRNRGPMRAYVDNSGLTIRAAQLVAEGTDLEASGTIGFRSRNPWNLRLRGHLNLPVLTTFEPELLATGVSTIDATVRGVLDRPQLVGRMEIKDGTFNLRGIPNGLEKTNGVIVFDRNRASIEKLTAQSGGGDLSVTGFVGFGGDQLTYRLQGIAQRVRVRYPEAVSTTFNADLSLTGTSTRSVLGGEIVVNKMGITPKTDIGSLLAQAGGSGPAPAAPNNFLRGMQIDLRLRSAPDAELQTSLARDIQPEADLRVLGSAIKPILLGRVSVNQGEIQFFGNQYTIARGDISFFNTAKVEPVLDFDLETRVRGVIVNMNFSGPVDKLNVSYRSDPPLQSSEIVALLTVGRTPGQGLTPNLPNSSQQQIFQAGSNTLLGQAISAPLSGSLERLFGVSRIKIDPELTGVTNTPQARLTVEQQISRDITVTYITNLNRTQQQIVRLQWDFSRAYSLLAVRDENGVFGVDLLFRRRF